MKLLTKSLSTKKVLNQLQCILTDIRTTNGRPRYIYTTYKKHRLEEAKQLLKKCECDIDYQLLLQIEAAINIEDVELKLYR
jgi:hypothetical protein